MPETTQSKHHIRALSHGYSAETKKLVDAGKIYTSESEVDSVHSEMGRRLAAAHCKFLCLDYGIRFAEVSHRTEKDYIIPSPEDKP